MKLARAMRRRSYQPAREANFFDEQCKLFSTVSGVVDLQYTRRERGSKSAAKQHAVEAFERNFCVFDRLLTGVRSVNDAATYL